MVETNLKSKGLLTKRSRSYRQHEAVFVIYKIWNIYPIDIYTSIDEKTNQSILAMVFLKEDTTEIYKKWCNYDLV